MVKIYEYRTHYEIHNYELGTFVKMERDLSVWDKPTFTARPFYFYDNDNRIMYVPRGYNSNNLTDFFKTDIIKMNISLPDRNSIFNMTKPPRDELQNENIRFIVGLSEYSGTKKDPQLVSSLPTGEGKTYCAIAATQLMKTKALVIVPTDMLRKQWKLDILDYTDLDSSNVLSIASTHQIMAILHNDLDDVINNANFFIATHSVLQSFMRSIGNSALNRFMDKLNVGVKFIDEAHKAYNNTLKMDCFSNVYKTVYISATFFLSDDNENRAFQKSFDTVFKFRKLNDDRTPHVQYIVHMFRTKINSIELATIKGTRGFDQKAYIDYELKKKEIFSIIESYLRLFIDKKSINGCVFILSTKKSSCDKFAELSKSIYPDLKICSYHSDTKKSIDNIYDYDIICATPKMLGTGNDFPDLRVVINTEPSKTNLQIKGRLRSPRGGGDTYYVEILDKAIPTVMGLYRERKKQLGMVNDIKKITVVDTTKKKVTDV